MRQKFFSHRPAAGIPTRPVPCAGVDIKAISEQLGHANVKTTYNIYVHLLEDTKEKEIDKLAGIDKLLA